MNKPATPSPQDRSKRDQAYLDNRTALSAEIGPQELWSVMDHWPLFVGVRNLARYLSILDLLKRQLSVPGHIAEFGTWRGANLMFMAKCLQILDPLGGKHVHCFDNFVGLPTFSEADGPEDGRVGTYRGSPKELARMIELYELGDTIAVHPGPIEETLPAALVSDRGLAFSMIYFDADIYDPAKAVLDHCHERLVKGGIFVFDEWNFSAWPGESLAVREFMDRHGSSYAMEAIAGTRQPSLVLRKL